MLNVRRRLRGTITNAVGWGICWSALGFATNIVLRFTHTIDAPVSVLDALEVGLKIGVGGGIAGVAFSVFISFAYRNRSLPDISCLGFGIGGALAAAVSITAFVQGASVLGGGRLVPWRYMESTLAMFSAFGFAAAAVSMKLAQIGTAREHRTGWPYHAPIDGLPSGISAAQEPRTHDTQVR